MSICYPLKAAVCYPPTVDYQKMWEDFRAKEWQKVYNRRLEEYRRMMLYQLQWGRPTGPYWTQPRPYQIMVYNRCLY